MAFPLPLIAVLLGGSLVSQVPLQVESYRGGNEEERSNEEVRPKAESDEEDWLSGSNDQQQGDAAEVIKPPLTPPPAFNKRRYQRPVVRPGLPRSLHVDSLEPIDQ